MPYPVFLVAMNRILRDMYVPDVPRIPRVFFGVPSSLQFGAYVSSLSVEKGLVPVVQIVSRRDMFFLCS